MATVKDVVSLMEEIAPAEFSDLYCKKYNTYDNSGLLLGDEDRQIFSVLVCLDLTSEVATEAEDINADMIITHHPFIFEGLKSITKQSPIGKTIYKLIKNDVAVYSAHLNFDVAPFGINQILADRLELQDCKVMQPIGEEAGLGRVGTLKNKCTLKEIFDITSALLNDSNIKLCGDINKEISVVAIVCGGGGSDSSLLQKAYNMGADLLITSEVKHHVALLAKELDIAIIDGGHYSTENFAIPVLTQLIAGYAENKNLDIEVSQTIINTNPFE